VFWRSRNAQRRVNTELERHQTIIEEQARKIENANIELQERNTLLIDANEELQNTYSQIHQQTKSLQEKNLALEQLNNEKNDLVAIVAHDLKNPIAAIRGLSELTHQQIDEGAQIKEIIAQISRTADRMLELVKNILDMNRLESGTVQINVVAFDIEPLTKGIVSTFTEQAAAKSITLNFHSKEANIIVQADEQATMQILENLISNAVKYSPHGKNIFVRVQSQKNTVRVEVQDEGPGISEEDMKKLFGKFARLSARPTGGEHSTGLGLSIVKKMVEAMNGRVWCESELGKGATFIVELPRA
jgi:signal transduction histidine kinase